MFSSNKPSGRDISEEQWEERKQSYELLLEDKNNTIKNLERRLESYGQGRNEDIDI